MRILLLGATGSIGRTACKCIRRFPGVFTLVGVSAHRSVGSLLSTAAEFGVKDICVSDAAAAAALPAAHHRVWTGRAGLVEMVEAVEFDVLLNALVGFAGLAPTVAALRKGKRVALANKESLVAGGDLINGLLAGGRGSLVPVDSEHSAILQCINGEHRDSVESIILTASGGPFRDLPLQRLSSVTPDEALCHPVWAMGEKITIDSATLVNKGFEIIEAHHLFHLPYRHLRVWIHPQSIIHSMVEFHDGAIMAQLGLPDMELPIQYALSHPSRLAMPGRRLDLAEVGSLTFEKPDMERFSCLRLCIEAGEAGGAAPVALNAANEVAVAHFLGRRIPFTAIGRVIGDALNNLAGGDTATLEGIEDIDSRTRARLEERMGILCR